MQATLRLEYAQTIALAISTADSLEPATQRVGALLRPLVPSEVIKGAFK